MIRRAVVVGVSALTFVAAGVFAVVAAPAASAQYIPTQCGFIVTPQTVAPGQQVDIIGQGFPPNQPVTFTLAQFTIATAVADSAGNVSATGTIPPDIPAGTYTISVDCLGVSSTQTINVSSNAQEQNQNPTGSQSTAGNLANTGTDVMPFVKAALLLLACGGLLLIAARRRGDRDRDDDRLPEHAAS